MNHFAPKKCFYPHPYLGPALLVARISVIAATMVWAWAVLLQIDTLNNPTYRQLSFIEEDLLGVFFLMVSGVQLYRTWFHSRPHWGGSFLNGAMAFLWTYSAIGLLFFWQVVPAGGFGACVAMMGLSWFNVIATVKAKS